MGSVGVRRRRSRATPAVGSRRRSSARASGAAPPGSTASSSNSSPASSQHGRGAGRAARSPRSPSPGPRADARRGTRVRRASRRPCCTAPSSQNTWQRYTSYGRARRRCTEPAVEQRRPRVTSCRGQLGRVAQWAREVGVHATPARGAEVGVDLERPDAVLELSLASCAAGWAARSGPPTTPSSCGWWRTRPHRACAHTVEASPLQRGRRSLPRAAVERHRRRARHEIATTSAAVRRRWIKLGGSSSSRR